MTHTLVFIIRVFGVYVVLSVCKVSKEFQYRVELLERFIKTLYFRWLFSLMFVFGTASKLRFQFQPHGITNNGGKLKEILDRSF